VPAGTTLAEVVAALGHEPQAVSTAVNEQFVPRGARGQALAEGDSVMLFQPIVGG
jgi:sulfur carrier protein